MSEGEGKASCESYVTHFALRMNDIQTHLTVDSEQRLVYDNLFGRKLA